MMGDRAEPLMTVHLLANSGYSAFLQQALDRLMDWICPDVPLFFVSERAAPLKYYERYRRRNCGFPGISVLLFLHEDLGEERILQIQDLLQRPPWHHQCVPTTWARSPPHTPALQDFYGLDDQMPVWGIRRVGCSPEILRVTLYFSFDNYDDAVGLYEMILRKEATTRKSNFCVFMLYATKAIAVQLCLKQLPIGMAAEPKESSLLQFKVQEMGQLVPLLPNPCVPISSTRWQTQDYEGNKILLQVQDSSKQRETSSVLPNRRSAVAVDGLLHSPIAAPLPTLCSAEQGGQQGWALRGRVTPVPGHALPMQQPNGSLSGSSRGTTMLSRHVPMSSRQQKGWPCRPAAETNVDTGLAVGRTVGCHCSLQHNLVQPWVLSTACTASHCAQPPSAVANRRKAAGHGAPGSRVQTRRDSPGTRPEEEEEFFI
ncbi:protein FAM124B [Coturnix japonica]|uniref:Family with sequence similarity 124 member B n=1 Tax=Coturnix japonica TaxID=93934 RepID=A0A8C2T064_COTJA|nr:protein FAM124B [Coturnix japonica]